MHNTRRSQIPLEIYRPELSKFERENKKASKAKEPTMNENGNDGVNNGNNGAVLEQARQENQQGNGRTLMEFSMPDVNGAQYGITRPRVNANNFEIKPALLQMLQATVQFHGHTNEDPNAHIANFLEICDTFKYNGVSDDAVRLRLFPFTLKDRAKSWLGGLQAGSVSTWDQLAQAFLAKYFPIAKTARIIKEITNFQQFEGESLYEAWE